MLDIEAYRSKKDLPKLLNDRKIEWDEKNFCLWLPLLPNSVPFHLSTIKNIAVQHEGRYSTIRVNFITPHKPGRLPIDLSNNYKPPVFIQELTFRSAASGHYQGILSKFKELLKQFNPLAGHGNGGPVLQTTSGARPTLDDLLLRPPVAGKRTVGRLEYHRNGFRFRSRKEDEIDLLNSNIKLAAYMPADEEDIFILHFEMKEPVVYGGRRVKHLQFFTRLDEANDNLVESSDKRKRNRESANSSGKRSEDVYTQRITAAEKAYETFIRAVEKESKNEIVFEEPDLEEGFLATIDYEQLNIYPTANCLIGLTSQPYFVTPYDELEFVAFERAGMMNKTFDMAFIWKDYSREVIRLSSIASSEKTGLKKLLDSHNIIVIEHNSSIKWQALLRKFSENMEEFIEDGAWEYLGDKEKKAKGSQDDDSHSRFNESEESGDFSDADEDFDSEEYGDSEDDESDDGDDEDDDDDSDDYDDEGDDDDQDSESYEQDSEDSLIVRKKGEPKKPAGKPSGKNQGKAK